MLARWVAAGIISADQAARIRAVEATAGPVAEAGPVARGASLVTEAMGYLGGVLILVASATMTGRYWGNLPAGGRIAVAGAAAALLLTAGGAVPRSLGGVGVRLRGVLWLASSAAVAGLLALVGSEGFVWRDESIAFLASSGTALYSVVLWSAHRHLLQHVAVFGSLLTTAGTAAGLLPDPGSLPGLAVWGVGAMWAVLAWGGIVRPRQPGMIVGGIAAVLGVAGLVQGGWGAVLALLTVGAVVVAAVAFRDMGLLALGAIGALVVLPAMMARYFPGAVSAAAVLLVAGVGLVVAAILTARRRRGTAEGALVPDLSAGTARPALLVCAGIAVVTAATILAAGLA